MNKRRLLVIVAEALSQYVKKGEIIDRYFNPGDVFDDVVVLMTKNDAVEPQAVQALFGRGTFSIRSLSRPGFLRSLGWRESFLRNWIEDGIRLASELRPAVIRTYGNWENGYLGAQIKKRLGIPLVVSLHGDHDEDVRGKTPWWPHWRDRLVSERLKYFERETLQNADWVLPVYSPIVDYAKRYGARNVRVYYNMTNRARLKKKNSYELHSTPRLVSVGRQFEREKNPENVIRAVAPLRVKLTLVGDGPHHQSLRKIAQAQRGPAEFEFIKALPNDVLCGRLPEFDVFVTQTENYEISKSVLEAMLTGLPVVLNRRKGKQVPELDGDWVRLVADTPGSFRQAVTDLLASRERRQALGERAFAHSRERYSPERTEAAYADLYRQLLEAHL